MAQRPTLYTYSMPFTLSSLTSDRRSIKRTPATESLSQRPAFDAGDYSYKHLHDTYKNYIYIYKTVAWRETYDIRSKRNVQ